MSIYRANSNIFISTTVTNLSNVTIDGSLLVGDRFQGTVAGYTSGGTTPGGYYGATAVNTIDKFPFSTDSNATDVGDLTQTRGYVTGQTSTSHGYTSGGSGSLFPQYTNVIDRFPFATNVNASDVGDLNRPTTNAAGISSADNGYVWAGNVPPSPPVPSLILLQKFPFATSTASVSLTVTPFASLYSPSYVSSLSSLASQNSPTHGYLGGGGNGGRAFDLTPSYDPITKFPFANEASISKVGKLINLGTPTNVISRYGSSGQSSRTHGYVSGGIATGSINNIEKFSFSADGDSTDVGDLSTPQTYAAGQSSISNGYNSGGNNPAPTINTIQKFPFATDSNATDISDLSLGRTSCTGQQD